MLISINLWLLWVRNCVLYINVQGRPSRLKTKPLFFLCVNCKISLYFRTQHHVFLIVSQFLRRRVFFSSIRHHQWVKHRIRIKCQESCRLPSSTLHRFRCGSTSVWLRSLNFVLFIFIELSILGYRQVGTKYYVIHNMQVPFECIFEKPVPHTS